MASAAPYLPPPVHERHRPELTPLHQLASAHWPRFLARADEAGGLPSFVRKEFEAYLDCGIAGKGSRLRKKYSWLGKVYWAENIVWSPGYFVSSVGVDEETIKRYVEHQGQQDSGQFQMKL